MAVFKLIPLLCTHVYSYMFSTMHPPSAKFVANMIEIWLLHHVYVIHHVIVFTPNSIVVGSDSFRYKFLQIWEELDHGTRYEQVLWKKHRTTHKSTKLLRSNTWFFFLNQRVSVPLNNEAMVAYLADHFRIGWELDGTNRSWKWVKNTSDGLFKFKTDFLESTNRYTKLCPTSNLEMICTKANDHHSNTASMFCQGSRV
jgi:hypothetical protein